MDIKDNRVYLLQVGLQHLGFYQGGLLDGDEGPKTKAAIAAWYASISKAIPIVDNSPSTPIASKLVSIGRSQLGVVETSKNQGPGLAKYWDATSYNAGYKNREPYCAAFVCWVVREAVGGSSSTFSLPKSPVAYDFEKWGAANKSKGVSVHTSGPKVGDIFTLSVASHVGIVTGVGKTTFTTIEGNTDGAGSREGDGVYEKTRPLSHIRKLIRIS